MSASPTLVARAPGKTNLCLYLGARRADGLHELVSLIESLSLADELELALAPAGAKADQVLCPGIEGPNLAAAALEAWRRAAAPDAPPLRLRIDKRVPVAAGMGGGSGDAAAALRLAAQLAGRPGDKLLWELAPALGADVASQLEPGLVLVTGAGERVRPLAPLAPHALLVLPAERGLSTAEVYREADRLGLPRRPAELERARERLEAELAGADELPLERLCNDLEPAALSLRPEIAAALADARAVGAVHALVSGSGPTVVGVFDGEDALDAARAAVGELRPRYQGACAAVPVDAAFAAPVEIVR